MSALAEKLNKRGAIMKIIVFFKKFILITYLQMLYYYIV